MMDIAFTILFGGVGAGAFLVACAYTHRVVTETRMKRRALDLTIEDDAPEKEDELRKRLEEFRRTRFSPPMGSNRRSYRSE